MKFHTTSIVKSINALIVSMQTTGELVTALKAAFHIGTKASATRDEVRAEVNQCMAAKFGETLTDKGNLPNASKNRRQADRIVSMICDGDKAALSLEASEEMVAAARKLLKLCEGFEFKGLTTSQVKSKLVAAAIAAAK